MAATNEATGKPNGAFIPGDGQMWAYATLALGSAMALFMYPHSVTATLSSESRTTIRRNAAILPAYSFVLGLLALLGWVAIAAGTQPIGVDGKPNPQLVIPQLFEDSFPSWFAGVAFAAVAIGALVPAAIMSIAAANTFTRNIYKEWIKPHATHAEEAKVSKLASLVVKAFALVFVLTLDKQNAINFQLLGGIWILQTFPAIVFSLYTRWFHKWALLAGWAVGMVYGTVAAYNVINPVTGKHFGGSLGEIPGLGDMGYIAMTAFALNVVIAVVLLGRAQRDQGVQRRRRDDAGRLLRRRRRPAGGEGQGRRERGRGRRRTQPLVSGGDDHRVGALLEVPRAAALGAADLTVGGEPEVLAGDGDLLGAHGDHVARAPRGRPLRSCQA